MKKAIVFGAGGFIGNHLVSRLKSEGYWVRGVDLKHPLFGKSTADEFLIEDLRLYESVERSIDADVDELYQLAAEMGGAGYLFTGDHDARVLHDSGLINIHCADLAVRKRVKKLFFSSSACIYPRHNQSDPYQYDCSEDSVYPADPDSDYGWEKLTAERIYQAYRRNYGLNIRIGRFHNVYGPDGAFSGGREKAPAAICRKVAMASEQEFIEVWGDGSQTRSFLYIDDCIEAVRRLMNSNFQDPLNIGSEEMVSLNELTSLVIRISKKDLFIRNVNGPQGVRSRNSDNRLIRNILRWEPQVSLEAGITKTFSWIKSRLVVNPEMVMS